MTNPLTLPFLQTGNVAETLFVSAEKHPERLAVCFPVQSEGATPQSEDITYGALLDRVKLWMGALKAQGLKPGDRVLVLFPVSLDLYAVIPALYAIGCVALLVDPGMGSKKITQALNAAKPKAVISVHALLKWRFLLGALRRIPLKISLDSKGWGLIPIERILSAALATTDDLIPRVPSDQALVTFTSGSTGAPKGADRNHGFLLAQHAALQSAYPAVDGQIDMTCFPVVVFHNLMCGVTSIMPNADIARPATVDPLKVIHQMKEHNIETLSGGPAFIEKIIDELNATGQSLPDLRTLACGGGPVSALLQEKILKALPHVKSYVVYGSTEAEPMCHHVMSIPIESKGGYIAGKPLPFVNMKLVQLPKRPELGLDWCAFEADDVGEVVVSGPHVNEKYIDNVDADRQNKVLDSNGVIWHRTGDRGRFDAAGNLWLVGRVKDIVHHQGLRLDPFLIDEAVCQLSFVDQAALIEWKKGAALFVSPEPNAEEAVVLFECLQAEGLNGVSLFSAKALPVDGRHNSKIDRPMLRKWLQRFWWFGKPFQELKC